MTTMTPEAGSNDAGAPAMGAAASCAGSLNSACGRRAFRPGARPARAARAGCRRDARRPEIMAYYRNDGTGLRPAPRIVSMFTTAPARILPLLQEGASVSTLDRRWRSACSSGAPGMGGVARRQNDFFAARAGAAVSGGLFSPFSGGNA